MTTVDQKKQIDELYRLIEKIKTAMLTSRRQDGRLVSRPMATQKRKSFADLWFVTDTDSHKLDELENDPHVNLAYFEDWEWVSVSGTARISNDRALIREVYQADWKAWFGQVDDVRDGGPEDPRLALILVDADSVTFMKRDKSKPALLFEVAKAFVTGETPDLGKPQTVNFN
jgi:general stress protein 26